jgi:hypothetical protein
MNMRDAEVFATCTALAMVCDGCFLPVAVDLLSDGTWRTRHVAGECAKGGTGLAVDPRGADTVSDG